MKIISIFLAMLFLTGCAGKTQFGNLSSDKLAYDVNESSFFEETSIIVNEVDVETKPLGGWWVGLVTPLIYRWYDNTNREAIAEDLLNDELNNAGFKISDDAPYVLDVIFKVTEESAYTFDAKFTIKNHRDAIVYENIFRTFPTEKIGKHEENELDNSTFDKSYDFVTRQFIYDDVLLHSSLHYGVKQFIRDIKLRVALGGVKKNHIIAIAQEKTPKVKKLENLAVFSAHSKRITPVEIFPNHSTRLLALVIGNGNYIDSPLKNPANDAEDISRALQNLGFSVMTITNANKRETLKGFNQFSRKLSKYDAGLFYYAGHGVQIDGRNYIIPVDATIENEFDVEFEGVDIGRLLRKMEEHEGKTNIVLLDACRNNPYAASFRNITRGLARIDAPTGSFIAFSTAPGKVASDGTGRNGLFTKHLLRHISTPNLPIEDVLKRVRIGVMRDTNNQQVPWQSSSMTGDFYFAQQ